MKWDDLTESEHLNANSLTNKLAYSAEARKKGIEGEIIIKLIVDANENPENFEIVKR